MRRGDSVAPLGMNAGAVFPGLYADERAESHEVHGNCSPLGSAPEMGPNEV